MRLADEKTNAVFKIEKLKKPQILFEDDNIVAIDKPPFLTSEEIAQSFKFTLLHRLDKETSGVLLLSKSDDFTKNVIETFRAKKVEKIYLAIVSGKFVEPMTIETPLHITKTKSGAFAKPSKNGQSAVSIATPRFVEGKNSIVEVSMQTGRTHQIRVHLKSVGFPVVGDEKYGEKTGNRIMFHAWKILLLGYSFESTIPPEFSLS
jgi:23S rRNA pseudouridine955/2504/2580 synthase/23S rRNA pseudouridine1911/1915/1917 synthase